MITLADGSMITMDEGSQKYYKHGIDKEKDKGSRINLTFRLIDFEDKAFKKEQERFEKRPLVEELHSSEPQKANIEHYEPDPAKKIKLSKEELLTAETSDHHQAPATE